MDRKQQAKKTTKQVRIVIHKSVDNMEVEATTNGAPTQQTKPPPEPDPKANEAAELEKQGLIATAWQTPNASRWKKLPLSVITQAKGYTAEEIFGEAGRSMHNKVKQVLTQKALWEGNDTLLVLAMVPSVQEITKFFQAVMDGRITNIGKAKVSPDDPKRTGVKQMIADLSLTDPRKCFGPSTQENRQTTMANQMSIMWAAAINYMGSQYQEEISPPEVDLAAEPMEEDSDNSSHDLKALITKRPLCQSNLTAFTTTVKDGKSKRPKTVKSPPAAAAMPNHAQDTGQPGDGETGEDAAKKQGWTTVEAREMQIGNIKRRHYERFEMRLKIPKESRKPVRDFQARFAQWWEEAKEMDKSLVIRPWYKNKKKGCISTTEGVPAQWKDLRIYVGKANPSSRSEDVYMQILLASNVGMQIFTSRSNKMEGSYAEGEYAYIQDLWDAEHITEIGFMVYSGNFTKAKQTLEVISQLLEENRAKIKVGGRVKFIGKVQEDVQDAHRANGGSWYNAPWMALHIHADVKDARRASKMLGQIFNKSDAHRGGLNYRYVPKPGTSVMGAKTATKVKAMIKKHQRHVRQLKYEQLKGDFALDEKDPETKQITLRQFLAKQTKDGCPLIHDVSTTHMADGKDDAIHIVAFGERFPEAVGIIHTIAVRCATEINASTNEWFSDDIVEMSCLMQKDDSGDYVDAEMELEMDFLLDKGFGEVQIDGMGMVNDDREPSPRRKKPRLEDESVYTFTTELGKSVASSRYTQLDSQTEAEEIENEMEAVMREARKDQEAEFNHKRVQEQSNAIASKDSIIAALRAQLQASGSAPPDSSKGGGTTNE